MLRRWRTKNAASAGACPAFACPSQSYLPFQLCPMQRGRFTSVGVSITKKLRTRWSARLRGASEPHGEALGARGAPDGEGQRLLHPVLPLRPVQHGAVGRPQQLRVHRRIEGLTVNLN